MDEQNNGQKEPAFVEKTIINNVIEQGNFLGFPYRQWAEAIGFTLLFILIVLLIPFTKIAKFFICLVYGFTIFGFSLKGIKNRSITLFLSDEYKFRKNRRILHLRGPEYIKTKADIQSYEGGDDFIGKQIERIKYALIQGADKILSEADSESDEDNSNR